MGLGLGMATSELSTCLLSCLAEVHQRGIAHSYLGEPSKTVTMPSLGGLSGRALCA